MKFLPRLALGLALFWTNLSSQAAESTALKDSDYDGRNDAQEARDGTDPQDPNSCLRVRLAHWNFNQAEGATEDSRLPLQTRNLRSAGSFDGQALQSTNSKAATLLLFRDVEPDGQANINCRAGSIRLWYKPLWTYKDSSAAPGAAPIPGQWVRLIEMGSAMTENPVGLFALSIDPNGTNLVFQTQDDKGGRVTNLQVRLNFSELQRGGQPKWHEIVLNYSPAATALRVDGIPAGAGNGVTLVPPPATRSKGFSIGSGADGDFSAQGLIDELETFNYANTALEEYRKLRTATATVSDSPPQITISWFGSSIPTFLQRRTLESSNWVTLDTSCVAFSYVDRDVKAGQLYEYIVGGKYLVAGINCPLVENRGRVLLLVDNTLSKALGPDLDQFEQDLVGDGWRVVRHDVPRHDDESWPRNTNKISEIKRLIVSDYAAAPSETKCVVLVGHVAVPYSGYFGRDGHATNTSRPDHQGAWPTDMFYGEVRGQWTDRDHDYVNIDLPAQTNLRSDGKFDQNNLPAPLALGVGRVDFARMPTFFRGSSSGTAKSEIGLLRQYFNKDHRYRHRLLALPSRGLVAGKFPTDTYSGLNASIYYDALRNCSRLFGTDSTCLQEIDFFVETRPFAFGFLAGYGSTVAISSPPFLHQTTDLTLPQKEPKGGFYVMDGSFFGDWNLPDNLLRALLGTPNYGLASMWARNMEWSFENLAMGDSLGAGLVRTANDTAQFPLGGFRDLTILGDPTLRLQILAPPANLSARLGQSSVDLKWDASPDGDAQYYVYRSEKMSGPFRRITSSAVGGTNYKDQSGTSSQRIYQVRASKFTVTGTGSFTNLSQGIFARAK